MSVPRFIVPGTTSLVSRRCANRQFFLAPSTKVNQIFRFCLAVAAARTGCLVHAYCAMSNHYHLVVTDVHGNLPVFMHWFNEYVAKCINVELGRWESFWAPGSYSSVSLTDEPSVIAKLVYTYTNPVSAGLVPTFREWPGAHSTPEQIDGPAQSVTRPEGFFSETGSVPPTSELKLVRPPALQGDRTLWLPMLNAKIEERESEIRLRLGQRGRRFLGCKRVLEQSPWSCPRDFEPRRGLNPRLAFTDKWRRVEALQRLKTFLQDYAAALKRFVGGDRDVTFPYGTYAMKVRFRVNCAGP